MMMMIITMMAKYRIGAMEWQVQGDEAEQRLCHDFDRDYFFFFYLVCRGKRIYEMPKGRYGWNAYIYIYVVINV